MFDRGTMGSVFVTAEELASCKDEVHFRFRAHHLDKKDFFGKSDPFLTISRLVGYNRTEMCARLF